MQDLREGYPSTRIPATLSTDDINTHGTSKRHADTERLHTSTGKQAEDISC